MAACLKYVAILVFFVAIDALEVSNLQCEYMANPQGLDTPQPRFSWELASAEEHRGLKQLVSAKRLPCSEHLLTHAICFEELSRCCARGWHRRNWSCLLGLAGCRIVGFIPGRVRWTTTALSNQVLVVCAARYER